MFEPQSHYFTYKLRNALALKGRNQFRMYEILKQYEYFGEHVFKIIELRDLLGIPQNEYPNYKHFRIRMLDACQKALAEHTDICFTYEVHGKRGPGGKILALKFFIRKNAKPVERIVKNRALRYIWNKAVRRTLDMKLGCRAFEIFARSRVNWLSVKTQ